MTAEGTVGAPTCLPRKRYVVSGDNVSYYLSKGLVLEKIHKVLRYRQAAWLRPYIELNTILRTKAKNEFEKDFFKLMNNAVYGHVLDERVNHDIVLSSERDEVDRQKRHAVDTPHFLFVKYCLD